MFMVKNQFYHVFIQKNNSTPSHIAWTWECNLTKAQVQQSFFIPFQKGGSIVCSGNIFHKQEIAPFKSLFNRQKN